MTTKLAVIEKPEVAEEITVTSFLQETCGDDVYPMLIILNVDKPDAKITSHDLNCKWVKKAKATSLKGVGSLKRDGGWMIFTEVADAREFCEDRFPRYKVKTCGTCVEK